MWWKPGTLSVRPRMDGAFGPTAWNENGGGARVARAERKWKFNVW